MNLIIVESPAKAKTIKSFLSKQDDDYVVIASKGHIRDLPKFRFGIKIENDTFTPEYEVSKDHKEIADEIKKLAKKADKIYIATDEDREGEAIGYHIAQIIGGEDFPRIVFHEITKDAILDALHNPRTINMNMVNAQQARRLLDRIVGFKLSPLLNQKIQKGLSAGRVQSSALKIIVDREREIKAFKPITYYSIDSIFSVNGSDIEASLQYVGKKKLEQLSLQDKNEASKILLNLKKTTFIVEDITTRNKKVAPPPPFMTSTLQQSASSTFGYSPSKTMQIAQHLYEGVMTDKGVMGVITYMRTDSLNIAKIAQNSARAHLEKFFGKNYVPKLARNYATKQKNAQEAHEAIRPTRIDFTPEIATKFLKGDEAKLYKLIYNRFLASQSVDASFQSQSILFGNGEVKFKASGSKLVFDGFYKIVGNSDKDKLLPELHLNDKVELKKCDLNTHITEPPPRYSEASLIKTLEGFGIGRPSTYAPIISLLINRDYVKLEKKQLVATDIAFVVTDILQKYFFNIVDSKFTAQLESKLDEIAECKYDWQEVLREFYTTFDAQIKEGKNNIASQKISTPTGEFCPKCGKELVVRKSKFGEFIACSGYPKCKYIKQDGVRTSDEDISDEVCPNCGKAMVKKMSRNGEFLACSGYPDCKTTKSLNTSSKSLQKVLEVKCPKCGGEILERFSRRGKFYGCAKYPKCDFTSANEPISKLCPECNFLMAKKETKTKKYIQCVSCKYKEDIK